MAEKHYADNMLDEEDQYETPINENEVPIDDGVVEEEVTPEPQLESEVEPESTDPEPEPEVTEPVNQYEQQFNDLGLNNQFKDVGDLLSRQTYMNKWQTQLSQENAELKRKVEEQNAPKPEEYNAEKFYENPDPYLDGRYAKPEAIEALQQKVDNMEHQARMNEFEGFRSSHEDFDSLEPTMVNILQANPALRNTDKPHELLYSLAKAQAIKAQQNAVAVQETTEQVQAKVNRDKAVATATPTTRKPKPSPTLTRKELHSKSLEELEAMYGDAKDDFDGGW